MVHCAMCHVPCDMGTHMYTANPRASRRRSLEPSFFAATPVHACQTRSDQILKLPQAYPMLKHLPSLHSPYGCILPVGTLLHKNAVAFYLLIMTCILNQALMARIASPGCMARFPGSIARFAWPCMGCVPSGANPHRQMQTPKQSADLE